MGSFRTSQSSMLKGLTQPNGKDTSAKEGSKEGSTEKGKAGSGDNTKFAPADNRTSHRRLSSTTATDNHRISSTDNHTAHRGLRFTAPNLEDATKKLEHLMACVARFGDPARENYLRQMVIFLEKNRKHVNYISKISGLTPLELALHHKKNIIAHELETKLGATRRSLNNIQNNNNKPHLTLVDTAPRPAKRMGG